MDIIKDDFSSNDIYSITELSSLLNITDHTLRFYEKEFTIPIPRDSRGRRYYTRELYEIFIKIKKMRDEGVEIKIIKECLSKEYNHNTIKNSCNLLQGNVDEIKHILNELYNSNNMCTDSTEVYATFTDIKLDKHFEQIDKSLTSWRRRHKTRTVVDYLFHR